MLSSTVGGVSEGGGERDKKEVVTDNIMYQHTVDCAKEGGNKWVILQGKSTPMLEYPRRFS